MPKFTELPAAGTQTGVEILAEVQGAVSKQVTVTQLLEALPLGYSGLPVATAQTGAEILAEVQGGVAKQVTVAQITSTAVNAQIGVNYFLQASDGGNVVTLDNGAPITVTIPAGLGVGFACMLVQLGAGQVTVAAGGGVTLNSYLGLVNLSGTYAMATVVAVAADSFVLGGTLS